MFSYLFVIMIFSSHSSYAIETSDLEACLAVANIVDKFLEDKNISAQTECQKQFDI